MRHPDPTISAFLIDGGYYTLAEWMLDSDYTLDDDDGETWRTDEGYPVIPEDAIAGAIEACGFEATL